MILEGRVSVNGRITERPAFRCDLEEDVIAVDGATIGGKRSLTIMMNKPAGVVTTRSDERGRRTVYDILGDVGRWVFPVGRLDRDTSGLLIFTNDNRLGETLTNPLSKVPKTYLAGLTEPFDAEDAEEFRSGMMLDGIRLRPAAVRIARSRLVEVTITEGKNRQIRRMFDALGYEIVSLCRVRIGGYRLQGIPEGGWMVLGREEIALMMGGTRAPSSRSHQPIIRSPESRRTAKR